MAKKSKKKSQINTKSLERDYKKIFKDFQNPNNYISRDQINLNQHFAKFSLYYETPNSIASCDTKIIL
jgi:hypothetical protein